MASSWPSSIDSFTDPSGSQPMSQSPQTHSQMHSLGNDAITQIETLLLDAQTVTSNTTATAFGRYHVDAAATVTLPASVHAGTPVTVVNITASSSVTVDCPSGTTFADGTTTSYSWSGQGSGGTWVYDGTSKWIIQGLQPGAYVGVPAGATLPASITPNEYWVSAGNKASDSNSGDRYAPFATLAHAVAVGEASGVPYVIHVGYGTFTLNAADGNGNGLTITRFSSGIQGMGLGFTTISITASGLIWGIKLGAAQTFVKDATIGVRGNITAPYWVVGCTVPQNGSAENGVLERITVGYDVPVILPVIPGATSVMPPAAIALGPDIPGTGAMDIAGWMLTHCFVSPASARSGLAAFVTGNGTPGNVTDNAFYECSAGVCGWGVYSGGSGYRWFGGGMGGNLISDFFCSHAGDAITVHSCRNENGNMAWQCGYVGPQMVSFISCSFGAYTPTNQGAGCIIQHDGSGRFIGIANQYRTTGNNANVKINDSGGSPPTTYVSVGESFDNPTPFPPADQAHRLRTIIGAMNYNAGAPIQIPGFENVVDVPLTTLNGTTAGTASMSQPESSVTYKKAVVWLNGYENTTATAQTLAFPVPFTNAPFLAHDDSGGATVNTTTLTLPASMGATKTGWIVVEGF